MLVDELTGDELTGENPAKEICVVIDFGELIPPPIVNAMSSGQNVRPREPENVPREVDQNSYLHRSDPLHGCRCRVDSSPWWLRQPVRRSRAHHYLMSPHQL